MVGKTYLWPLAFGKRYSNDVDIFVKHSEHFSFEPAANGIPSSVFFPQSDPEDRLSQCSASLQALLALSPTSLQALSKLVNNPEISEDIIAVIRTVIVQFPVTGKQLNPSTILSNSTNSLSTINAASSGNNELDTNIEIPLSVHLWRMSGCHELLASLGFDLMEVGQDQVTLRTGKLANRRNCQFVLQALLALFGMNIHQFINVRTFISANILFRYARSCNQS